MCANCLTHTPANTVPFNGVAHLLGDRNTKTRQTLVAAFQNFKQKERAATLRSTTDCKKFASFLEPPR